MPRYKVLKGVAHNIGHSFTSLMNYADDDYVLGHILRFARETGDDTLEIDMANGKGKPSSLLQHPITTLPERYSKMFWHNVMASGSDRSLVDTAHLRIQFDLQRTVQRRFLETFYKCNVCIKDNRGKEYKANFTGWWFVERASLAQELSGKDYQNYSLHSPSSLR